MAYWKVPINKIKKTVCNVCLEVLAEWRADANDVVFSVPA